MSDALEHLEAAIAEVEKARAAVAKGSSKQVRTGTEIDRLKAVAFAWFKTHRQLIQEGRPDVEMGNVDAPYQAILDATSRFAARSTYLGALKNAKISLVAVRRVMATTLALKAASQTPEVAPMFASLTADVGMQAILERRWREVQQCISAGANLAATVMMGGLLESLLVARINITSNKGPIFTAKGAPRDKSGKTQQLSEWKLVNMVDVAHELGWITKSAKDVGNVLRDFRNYIHPHKEHTDGVVLSAEDARMLWEVSKAITRQVLESANSTR